MHVKVIIHLEYNVLCGIEVFLQASVIEIVILSPFFQVGYNTAVYFSRVTHCVFLSSCPKFYTCSLHGQIKYYIQLESGFLFHMDIAVSQLHIYVVGPLNGFRGSGVSTLSSHPHYLCTLKWVFFKHLNVDLTHALA